MYLYSTNFHILASDKSKSGIHIFHLQLLCSKTSSKNVFFNLHKDLKKSNAVNTYTVKYN